MQKVNKLKISVMHTKTQMPSTTSHQIFKRVCFTRGWKKNRNASLTEHIVTHAREKYPFARCE